MSLTVTGPEGARLWLYNPVAGLQSLRFESPPGEIRITPEAGRQRLLEVIDPATVDAAGVRWVLPGYAGTDLFVEDQGAYGTMGFGRKINFVLPIIELSIGDQTLCTPPNRRRFEMTGTGACEVRTPLPFDVSAWTFRNGVAVDLGAKVVGDGRCTLGLRAPGFGPGDLLDVSLSFDLANTRSLIDLDD